MLIDNHFEKWRWYAVPTIDAWPKLVVKRTPIHMHNRITQTFRSNRNRLIVRECVLCMKSIKFDLWFSFGLRFVFSNQLCSLFVCSVFSRSISVIAIASIFIRMKSNAKDESVKLIEQLAKLRLSFSHSHSPLFAHFIFTSFFDRYNSCETGTKVTTHKTNSIKSK